MKLREEIGQELRKARGKLRRAEVAERYRRREGPVKKYGNEGVSETFIGQIERGEINSTLDAVEAYAAMLGVELEIRVRKR